MRLLALTLLLLVGVARADQPLPRVPLPAQTVADVAMEIATGRITAVKQKDGSWLLGGIKGSSAEPLGIEDGDRLLKIDNTIIKNGKVLKQVWTRAKASGDTVLVLQRGKVTVVLRFSLVP